MSRTTSAVAAAQARLRDPRRRREQQVRQQGAFAGAGEGHGQPGNGDPAEMIDMPVGLAAALQMPETAGANAARTAGAAAIGVKAGRQDGTPQAGRQTHRPRGAQQQDVGTPAGRRQGPIGVASDAMFQMPRLRHCSMARLRGSSKPTTTL